MVWLTSGVVSMVTDKLTAWQSVVTQLKHNKGKSMLLRPRRKKCMSASPFYQGEPDKTRVLYRMAPLLGLVNSSAAVALSSALSTLSAPTPIVL